MFDFHQLINEPSQVTSTTQTIVEQIRPGLASGVAEYNLNDHSMIYATRKIQRNLCKCHNTMQIRSLKSYSKASLNKSMNKTDSSTVLKCGDVDIAWLHFKSFFKKVVDNMAPIKIISIKQRTEPLVTDDILKSIRLINLSFAHFRKTRDESSFMQYKGLRN